ncbi:hypothetical protein KKH23_11170 [Patescibacteria group bacterium]|nr:hypothetical protein [Patescibacteria group bacterium]
MTIQGQCWQRSGGLSQVFSDNLKRTSGDPYRAALATIINTCGNCPTRIKCEDAILADLGITPEMLMDALGKAMARCETLYSWKIDLKEVEARAAEEPKMRVLKWIEEKPEDISE